MPLLPYQYRNAVSTLAYIGQIKEDLEAMLYSKTHLMHSGIHLPLQRFRQAIECINETIDDLYKTEQLEARRIMELWDHQNRD